jgi:DUF4097 and DUF4098 domain-containing protein YvlB
MKRMTVFLTVFVLAATLAWAGTPLNESKPAKADGRVTIENVVGSVTVVGWDKAEVQVQGTLGDGNQPLLFEVAGGGTRIKVRQKQDVKEVEKTDLTVSVPKGSRLEVGTVSADVEVRGILGEVKVETVSGTIRAAEISGSVEAESVSGTVNVNSKGRSLQCGTVSGRLEVVGAEPERVKLESVSGEMKYEGGLARTGQLKVESVSGSVELALPSSISADFDVTSFSGSIHSDLGTSPNVESEGAVGKKAHFTMGAGEGSVSVETLSGGVRFLAK